MRRIGRPRSKGRELATPRREAVSVETETRVLTRSARRCALCFGLEGDLREKAGQVAHIDGDRSNGAEDNLVFLCLEHHDRYDSTTSQSKGITPREVRNYRERLYRAIETGLADALRVREALALAAGDLPGAEEVRLHDGAIFKRADAIMSERSVLDLLDQLQGDNTYTKMRIAPVDRFVFFFEEAGNWFLLDDLVTPAKALLKGLDGLREFTANQFFVYPKEMARSDDCRYALHPELNIDREGGADRQAMARYRELQRQLDELCSQVRLLYREYRLAVKRVLLT